MAVMWPTTMWSVPWGYKNASHTEGTRHPTSTPVATASLAFIESMDKSTQKAVAHRRGDP